MKPFFIAFFFFPVSIVFAQGQSIVSVSFLKNNGKYVTNKDSADYFRTVSAPDSGSNLFTVIEYYKDGKKKLIGKSSKVDPPVFEGTCVRFYSSGQKQNITNYKNNIATGDAYEFYPNGKPYIQIEYPDNGDRYNSYSHNFLIKANYDSLGVVQVQDGNGYYKGFDQKFSYIEEEGRVKNGKRDSIWNGASKNIGISFIEKYKDGDLISGVSVSAKGDSVTYKKMRGTPPQFKGGVDGFGRYLGTNIQYPDNARKNDIQGRVILSFVVEKDGTVTNIVVSRSVNPELDEEAVRVLKNSPKWIPGTQFGRAVRVTYSVPVNFALTD